MALLPVLSPREFQAVRRATRQMEEAIDGLVAGQYTRELDAQFDQALAYLEDREYTLRNARHLLRRSRGF